LLPGGAGFIGFAVIRQIIRNTDNEVDILDNLTYARNLESLANVSSDPVASLRRLMYVIIWGLSAYST
jgi:dTDP-glucose 4,6-dehydratase